jgi:uncharacterized membrane protein
MSSENDNNMVFGKTNYMILIAGCVTVFLGFLLMVGGGSDDPNVFNPEIFSPMRITVAPTLVLLGFGIVMYGIFKKANPEK